MHPFKYIEINSKRFPLSEIEDVLSPTSLAIAAEIRLASSAPYLLKALQTIASDGNAMPAQYAKGVLTGLGFQLK